jgi:ABC-type iron transport system FetAB permease component
MHPSAPTSVSHLDWLHVGFGIAFVAFISAVSELLHLHVGASLAIAALRCMAQLTIMGVVLQHVLVMTNLWAVAGIACMNFPPRSIIE